MGTGPEKETRTVCPYCGVGCGLLARTEGDRLVEVAGDPIYPVNRGRTCRKPLELPAAVHARDRALHPLLRCTREERFDEVGWDQTLATLAGSLSAIIDRHGPDAVAFYISGQLLTEDYYAVNKLVKGFIGTNNVDSNSRLCMSSAVAGYQGAFGSDGPPPGYSDLDLADCFLLLGSNAAACHPIVWSRIRDRRQEGAFVICADPRPTQTAQQSDLHLPVAPGTDLALLSALLHVIVREGLCDEPFVASHTSGFEQAAAVAADWPPERAAEVCGVPAADIVAAALRFGRAPRAMVLWSMGANQSTVGTLKNRALINLCLATGQIGRPGTGPLSLTGQPNAMGGRESGGLAHLLPGYRKVTCAPDRAEIERLWGCPPLSPEPGLPAVELFDALAEGRVKAVWIVATNPVVSLPDAARARAALERAELVVVQDAYHPTETSALAHAVLPAAAWPEKTGTMTNSERRVGLVRAALAPPGEALPDWRIFAGLAAALGHRSHFGWASAAEVFEEFTASTAGRLCDMTGLTHARLARDGGVQWPVPSGLDAEGDRERGGERERERGAKADRHCGTEGDRRRRGKGDRHGGTERLYEARRFPTPDGRARFAPTPHCAVAEAVSRGHPLVLTTGRVAEHWHTLTRTGKSPRLSAAASEPVIELNRSDAQAAGVAAGEHARVISTRGSAVLRVQISEAMPAGVAFAPMHWGALHVAAGAGAVNALTHGATDPTSLQPELKAAAVRVQPLGGLAPAPKALAPALKTLAPVPTALPAARNLVPPPLSGRRAAAPRRRLVVVGTGMAGLAVVEEVLRRPTAPWQITMLGEEPGVVYNRMLLSKLLARTCGPEELELRSAAWYSARGVDLQAGLPAVALDLGERTVIDVAGERHRYDKLVLATGSRPFVPPIDGVGLAHVHCFRTVRDSDEIAAGALAGGPAVVVGGGLLGLEAACGLIARGVPVTIVELADRVMAQQLDRGAAKMLARALEKLGLGLRLGRSVRAIDDSEVTLDDGERLPASIVVVAAGVRAETGLAREAGIAVGRGILVDDAMRAGAPGVFAVGECAEHRGVVEGLWAPIAEQAQVAGATIAGDPAGYHGMVPATTLKVAGVGLFAGGVSSATSAQDELVFSDSRRGVHRKLVLEGDRLAGALLVGDTAQARRLSEFLRSGEPLPGELLESGGTGGDAAVASDPETLVCSCNTVTRGTIESAIAANGLTTVTAVGRATRASTGCGSCACDVEAILAEHVAERERAGANEPGVTERTSVPERAPAAGAWSSSDRNTSGTGGKLEPVTISA
ncbi:MAG: molybdopterin-dependent oxidoreductase [Solirubrobacteraceae bacterium]